ncbi:MAG TPA: histidine phosphatase family protein [Terracidiphilus sp.]|jgi:broad specificity phosphatase PhoE
MGSLLIVRHAQASFLADNYDRLSAIGEAQSRVLGESWAARNLLFDRIFAGPRVRHTDTVKFVSLAYQNFGRDFPAAEVLPEFDEYPAEAVLEHGIPILLETDQRVRDLHAAFLHAVEADERRAAFQRFYEVVVMEWVRGALPVKNVETWLEFCSRVNEGIDKVLSASGRAKRVAIFTSGGPTAVALQRALHISPERTMQSSWMSRNSSWSEFLFSGTKFTLSSFNCYGHITEPAHLTYR